MIVQLFVLFIGHGTRTLRLLFTRSPMRPVTSRPPEASLAGTSNNTHQKEQGNVRLLSAFQTRLPSHTFLTIFGRFSLGVP